MTTLIYICMVELLSTPVVQKCHIEEIHNPPAAVTQWCRELREIDSGGHFQVSQCHVYMPGEESRNLLWLGGGLYSQ